MSTDLQETLEKVRQHQTLVSHSLNIVHAKIEDQRVVFAVDMENDPVQRNHRLGQFYETKELVSLQHYFPKGGVFIDVGANVGNHSLYAALFLGASKVVPIEPNPRAYNLLIQNVLLNQLTEIVDLSKLGVGLSDSEEQGYAMEDRVRNLGAARMLPGQGDIEVFRGDTLFRDLDPDMIKIDVENMELAVTKGLETTLKRSRPTLLVEVDNTNAEAFLNWATAFDYEVAETIKRYKLNQNYLMTPKAQNT